MDELNSYAIFYGYSYNNVNMKTILCNYWPMEPA